MRSHYLTKVFAVLEVEMRKLERDPTDLATRALQPALWLLVFGQVFTRTKAIPTGSISYEEFMTPGILAQSVLFMSIFYGLSAIWERDLGILQKYLVSPTPRSALVLGKGLAAGVRGVAQAVLLTALAMAVGVHLSVHPVHIVGVLIAIMLGAAFFSTFSLVIACLVKSRERFMGIGQVLTMPLFFASNAIYPVTMMPKWLQTISHLNPLTYQVDALRALMLDQPAAATSIATDFAVLAAATGGLVVIAARLYARLGT
ncbi:MAG TPA: ABC transporter permease [Fimbriimonas sp.]|nr:ABC transporter permease [Fimbriimonas sp.]